MENNSFNVPTSKPFDWKSIASPIIALIIGIGITTAYFLIFTHASITKNDAAEVAPTTEPTATPTPKVALDDKGVAIIDDNLSKDMIKDGDISIDVNADLNKNGIISKDEILQFAVISKKDLDTYKASTAKDCTTLAKFKSEQEELVATNYTLNSLDTNGQRINITRPHYSGGTEDYSVSWLTLPAVLDADCNASSWAKLQKGDKINFYVSSDNRYIDNGTDYVQKATR